MANKKKLKVMSLEVQDVLGVREFGMEPGNITVIHGKNATGKTSAIEAIKSAMGGGSLAKIARIDSDGEEVDPKIVIVMDREDGKRYRIEKNAKGTRVRAQVEDTAGFEDVPRPQMFLNGLFDGHLSNPIEFLRAPDKDRVIMLLGAMPVDFDRDALWEAMGIAKSDVSPVPEGLHPLQELALIRESVFRERTGVNRDAKAKAESAEQTRRNVPAVLPDNLEGDINKLDEEITEKDTEITKRIEKAKSDCSLKIQEIESKYEGERDSLTVDFRQWESEQRAELERKIRERKDQLAEKSAELTTDANNEIKEVQKTRDMVLDEAFADQKGVEDKRTELAQLREQNKMSLKSQALHEQAIQFDNEAEELKKWSQVLSDAIEAVDATRREMASNLPIPGLSIEGKQIMVDGVPFDQLNTAKRMETAVRVSCLRARKHPLPVVWVDGAEALDSENFKELTKHLEKEGVQAFIGKVDEGELTTTVVE